MTNLLGSFSTTPVPTVLSKLNRLITTKTASTAAFPGGPNLLQQVNHLLSNATKQATVVGNPSAGPASCQILNLKLGPLDLNVLGLEITLNNCTKNGAVTVNVSGVHGQLLGDLLRGLLG